MNILIADDEHLARERLRVLIADIKGNYQVVAEVADGEAVVSRCAEGSVDLVLLDIRMPMVDGLAAAARLGQMETPPAVVFVTAFDVHAVQAFERGAIDYLVKPVRRERLQQALERARALTRPQLQALQALEGASRESGERICTSYRGGVECVDLDEVVYFHADQKYVVVRHQGGRMLLESTLKSLEDAYAERFVRIHRNALVARHRLSGIERSSEGRFFARMRGCDDLLEISRRHIAAVRAGLKSG